MSIISEHEAGATGLADGAVVPSLECDLVMKGGITSGIVYPPAVQKLKEKYRFRSIGGTSAGAIAAALTAAAEHGRATGGFRKLEAIQQQFGEPGFIVKLFNPTPNGAPLLDAAKEIAATVRESWPSKGSVLQKIEWIRRKALGLIKRHFATRWAAGAASGMGVGLVAAGILSFCFILPLLIIAACSEQVRFGTAAWGLLIPVAVIALLCAIAGRALGGPVAVVYRLFGLVGKDLPGDFFGLVQGHSDDPAVSALTDWLADQIDLLAGLPAEQCLTFGMLADPTSSIDLRMMTTCVSHGRPYVLPFADEQRFIFNEAEFRRLFPGRIVDHLVAKALPTKTLQLPTGYFLLPVAGDVPVIVLTRMSLSFPLLIAAVPLYTVPVPIYARARANQQSGLPYTKEPVTAAELQRNWFSDGGICSNFPIHFFDAWLPSRPTFGITLSYLDEEAVKEDGVDACHFSAASVDPLEPSEAPDEPAASRPAALRMTELVRDSVRLPKANDAWAAQPEWSKIDGLLPFLSGIFSAAQNYRDVLQSELPGYRERVVQVDLEPDEGGLNLDMPTKVVKRIVRKGERAGEALGEFEFDDHRWARFLVLMAELEDNFKVLPQRLQVVEDWLAKWINDPGSRAKPYRRDSAWLNRARIRAGLLRKVAEEWNQDGELFVQKRPKPKVVLRCTPEI